MLFTKYYEIIMLIRELNSDNFVAKTNTNILFWIGELKLICVLETILVNPRESCYLR